MMDDWGIDTNFTNNISDKIRFTARKQPFFWTKFRCVPDNSVAIPPRYVPTPRP